MDTTAIGKDGTSQLMHHSDVYHPRRCTIRPWNPYKYALMGSVPFAHIIQNTGVTDLSKTLRDMDISKERKYLCLNR